jgi:hypothetical protein
MATGVGIVLVGLMVPPLWMLMQDMATLSQARD